MKAVRQEICWEGDFLRVLRVRYEGPDGVLRTWEAVERPRIRGIVLAVPVTAQGRVVFIRQYRPPVDARVIELPAGLNDRGESPAACALRELREETGYRASRMDPLVSAPSAPATSTGTVDVFLATGLVWAGREGGDENEFIENVEVPIEGALDFLLEASAAGERVDLKIFGLVELARRRLEGGRGP